MGFFDFFKKKKRKRKPEVQISVSTVYDSDSEREYYELLALSPRYDDFVSRPFNMPKYDNTYNTGTPYQLRELLLLVWWGNTKSGRKATTHIPKYFFNKYNLDAELLTNKFIKDGLLNENNDRIKLTDKGQKLFDKYYTLWEIHRVSNYPVNLDRDFPEWDKVKFDINYYKTVIKFNRASIDYNNKMIDFIQNHPELNDKSNQEQYFISNRNSLTMQLEDIEEKLQILERRYNDSVDKNNHK